MAPERPLQPELFGAAVARTEPKTAPAANAPTAPRRNVCREISPANVGSRECVMSRIVNHGKPRWRMTCRMTTENVSEPLPNLAELLAVNRSLLITRPIRRRRHLNRSCACQPTYSAVTDGMTWDDPAATARGFGIGEVWSVASVNQVLCRTSIYRSFRGVNENPDSRTPDFLVLFC